MEYGALMEMAVRAGEIMLASGAEVYRVEDTIHRILKHSGIARADVFVVTTGIVATIAATEAAIRTAFREDLKDTTKFIIAQRLSSLEYADRILVLEDGRIIGEGTQEKLLASCEAYREIYETQYGKRAAGEGMA